MAVDKQLKQKFNEEITLLKKKIEEIEQKVKYLSGKKDGNPNIHKILCSFHHVDLVSIYCAMTDLSLQLLGFSNESYLKLGRKNLYNAILMLEEVVSDVIDMPLSENYELLKSLDTIDDAQRLKMIRKLGYTVSLLEDKYGKSSKWKWSFVELEGRLAVIAKNLFDFRSYQEKNDPRIEGFHDRYDHLFLVKELLNEASRRYREKYEVTNHSPDDMKKALEYLRALKRIHILLNENSEVQAISKRIELWAQKFEADMKAKEKQMKSALHQTKEKKEKWERF